MDYLDYEVLKNRKNAFNEEEKERCFELLAQMIKLNLIANKEGLLAMEEHAYKNELEKQSITAECYKDAIVHVVDGNDPKNVELYLSNDIMFYGADTFQGYLCYLMMKGILSIQAGEGLPALREILQHCLPFSLREEARERLDAAAREYREALRTRHMESVDHWYPKKSKHPFLSVVSDKLMTLTDMEMDEFVKRAELEEMMMLLAYMPEVLRVKLLKHAPESVQEKFFDKIQYFSQEDLSKLLCSVMSALKNYS